MIRVDANYILRYLFNDNPEMANVAEKLFLDEVMTFDKKLNRCIQSRKNEVS